MHSIDTIDRVKRRISTTIEGFMTPADIVALSADTWSAVRSLGLASGAPHDLLHDLSASMVAPRETIAEIGTVMRNPAYKHLWARHIAFVARSALLRMQVERVAAGRPDLRVFADRPSAEAWLDAADIATTNDADGIISAAD